MSLLDSDGHPHDFAKRSVSADDFSRRTCQISTDHCQACGSEFQTCRRLRPSMNLSNLRWETGDWNMKVRISKFSRKWFYGCSENPSDIDEFQIRNENGRMVITPIPEKVFFTRNII